MNNYYSARKCLMKLVIEHIPVTALEQNCRILSAPTSAGAVVIDPGGDVSKIEQRLAKMGKACSQIWLTHSHFDHAGGVSNLQKQTSAVLYAHKAEEGMRPLLKQHAARYGLEDCEPCPEPDNYIEGGDVLLFGETKWSVLFTPGHSPGHVCFYCSEEGILLAGDALFSGSVGRTDLPGGDQATLMRSIRDLLMPLPDEVQVLSGHGPDTTIGKERKENPFRSLFLR
jgi:hydroxyacylglutathione hydrolase